MFVKRSFMIYNHKMKTIAFTKTENYTPRNKKEKALIYSLFSLKSDTDMANFIRDLMTLPEIEEFANRLEIARLLLQGGSYEMIAKSAGVSTTTVTRVAHWLFKGCGGYQKVLRNK